MRKGLLASIAVAMLAASMYWVGCGGSDDGDSTRFFGNVSTVTPTSSAKLRRTNEGQFALHWPQIPAQAFAAGSCVAPGGGLLLFCIQTSTVSGCEPVDANCNFSLTTAIEQDRDTATLTFVDDVNGNSQRDSGEAIATLPNAQVYCNGDQVQIDDAAVNFTSGFAIGDLHKIVDKCAGTVATQTPGPGSTATPTRTGTPATPTPTYSMGTSLNEPPSTMLAFLFSAGLVGALLPRRRRK